MANYSISRLFTKRNLIISGFVALALVAVTAILFAYLTQGPRYSTDEVSEFYGEFSSFIYPSSFVQDEESSNFGNGVDTAIYANDEDSVEDQAEVRYVSYDLADYNNFPAALNLTYSTEQAAEARDVLTEGIDQLYPQFVGDEFMDQCTEDPVTQEDDEKFENNQLQSVIVTVTCTREVDGEEILAQAKIFVGVGENARVHWVAVISSEELYSHNQELFDRVLRSVQPV